MKKLVNFFLISIIFSFSILVGCNNDSHYSDTNSGLPNITTGSPYYDSYLEQKINRINEIEANNNISYCFYYITDLHWDYNTQKSPYLISTLQGATNVGEIVFGGDYFSSYEKKSDAIKVMKSCITSFNSKNYIAVIGNHEMNRYTSNSDLTQISNDECNRILNGEKYEKSYFKIDDETNKICKIILNTNIFTANSPQYEWLKSTLKELGSEWTAFIFMHIYNQGVEPGLILKRATEGQLIEQLLEDMDNDIKCSIGGIFSGHTHRDYLDYNRLGYPVVSTMSDSNIKYYECDKTFERKTGTIYEQAFDVVQIDATSKTVYLTRIGAGADRQYDYRWRYNV